MKNMKLIDTRDNYENAVERVKNDYESDARVLSDDDFVKKYEDEILGEDSFLTDEAVDYLQEILHNLTVRYEQRYHTEVAGFIGIGERSSWYGYIGGNGAKFLRWCGVGETDKFFAKILGYNTDDFELEICDNMLTISGFDHDGVNSLDIKIVTEREYEKFENAQDDYYQGDYQTYIEEHKTPEPTKVGAIGKLNF